MISCKNCGKTLSHTASFCSNCGTKAGPVPANSNSGNYVRLDSSGRITIYAQTITEYKIALKELKLLKREISNSKRHVMENKRQVRAKYTDRVRRPRILKFMKDVDRRVLAAELRPLESQHQQLEVQLLEINRAILELESVVMQNP
jgi:hypothetical protein